MASLIKSDEIIPIVPVNGGHHGLSLFVASMFIVGEIAGTGVFALPEALKNTGKFFLIVRFSLIQFVISWFRVDGDIGHSHLLYSCHLFWYLPKSIVVDGRRAMA